MPARFHPGFLLGLVLHLATGWVSVSPEFEAAIDVPDIEERARHVEDAVRTLLSQPDCGTSTGSERLRGGRALPS